jgi:YVTN family beta-propeller protein
VREVTRAGLAALALVTAAGLGATAVAVIRTPARQVAPATARAAPVGSPVPVRASIAVPVVVASIPVNAEPEGVVVSPDSRTVYVAGQASRFVSIIDAVTGTVTDVRVPHPPRFVALARDGSRAYVSTYEDDGSGSGVTVIEAGTHAVVRTIGTGPKPYDLAVAPDGRLWVPTHNAGRVEVYAGEDLRRVATVPVPANPHSVRFAADGRHAYTPDHESNQVSFIDTRNDKVRQSVAVHRAPHSLAVSPDGRTILVACYEEDAVDRIDTVTMRRSGPFPVGKKPQSIAFAADGRHAYVADEGDDTVSVLDANSGKVTATIPVGRSPRSVAVAPDGLYAYVSAGEADTVTVLRVAAA